MLLAAGASTRMGRDKLALPFGDSTVLARSLGSALSGCERVILVTGGAVAREGGEERLVRVANPRPGDGMLSSLGLGLERVRSEWCFVALADMPLVAPSHYAKLYDALASAREAAARDKSAPRLDALFFGRAGTTGHPALLRAEALRGLGIEWRGDRLKPSLASLATFVLETDDPAPFSDVDTPEAYRATLHLV